MPAKKHLKRGRAVRVMDDDKKFRDELAVGVLAALAQAGIPPDIQKLLVDGDPTRGIAPGALSKACAIVWRSHPKT